MSHRGSPFLLLLATALPAQRELLDELPPDGDAWAHRQVAFGREFEPLRLPGEGAPHGVARIGDWLWLARGDRLLQLKWPGLEVRGDRPRPAGLRCLCAGPRFLYAAVGGEVQVIDPTAGIVMRTFANVDDRVILAHDGEHLHAVGGRAVWRCDRGTAAWQQVCLRPRGPVSWVVGDGGCFWVGNDAGVEPLVVGAPGRQCWRGCTWPMALRSGRATWCEGKLLVVAERNDLGHVGEWVAGLVDPDATASRERLSIGVYAQREGVPKFVVGPKQLLTIELCELELRRIAEMPSAMVPRPDGSRGPMPVVIEAHRGVRIGAVTAVWDAARRAGFDDISAPAQEAWVLAERAREAAKK